METIPGMTQNFKLISATLAIPTQFKCPIVFKSFMKFGNWASHRRCFFHKKSEFPIDMARTSCSSKQYLLLITWLDLTINHWFLGKN